MWSIKVTQLLLVVCGPEPTHVWNPGAKAEIRVEEVNATSITGPSLIRIQSSESAVRVAFTKLWY